MANTDNKCAELEIENLYSQSTDTLGDILNLQSETQRTIYGYNFEEMSLRELMEFWHMNNHALIDEIHEVTEHAHSVVELPYPSERSEAQRSESKKDGENQEEQLPVIVTYTAPDFIITGTLFLSCNFPSAL